MARFIFKHKNNEILTVLAKNQEDAIAVFRLEKRKYKLEEIHIQYEFTYVYN